MNRLPAPGWLDGQAHKHIFCLFRFGGKPHQQIVCLIGAGGLEHPNRYCSKINAGKFNDTEPQMTAIMFGHCDSVIVATEHNHEVKI